MTTLKGIFRYSGFNSTGSERDGEHLLIATTTNTFYVSHEQTYQKCPKHGHWKECKAEECKEIKSVGHTRRFAGFPNYLVFLDLYKQWSKEAGHTHTWKTFYEMIIGKVPQKPYFDLDYKGMTEDEAVHRMQSVRKAITQCIPGVEILTFESHGPGKFSYHLICRNVYVESSAHNKALATTIGMHLPPGSIDLSVYSSLQNFRLFDSTKKGKNRFKVLSDADTAQYYSEEIVRKFNDTLPVEQVQWRMIFTDSLITMVANAHLLPVAGVAKPGRLVVSKSHDFNASELKAIEDVIPEHLKVRDWSGLLANLSITDRSIPCLICHRTHDHENPYVQIRGKQVLLYCRRAMAEQREPPYCCLGTLSFTPPPPPPSIYIPHTRDALPLPDDTVSVGSVGTRLEGAPRWPGRPLDLKRGTYNLRHSAVFLVYGASLEEKVCLDTFQGSPLDIKKIQWKLYESNGTVFTTVEMYFNGRVARKVDDLFNIDAVRPTEIRVLATGTRKFMLPEHLNALSNPDEEKLTNEDIMELVKHCQTESEVYRVAKEPRFNATFLRIWKANTNEIKRITKIVEHCTMEKQVMALFPDLVSANKALSVWKQIRRTVKKSPVRREQLWPWQLQWEAMLSAKGDPRMVKVIVDDHGNKKNDGGCIGKGTFADYMEATYPEQVCSCPNVGDLRDMATAIESAVKHGWNGRILLIDLARPARLNAELYQFLEQMCNGKITVLKYLSSFLSWTPEHIVVFTNRHLDVTKMSSDRWQLYTANDPMGTVPGTDRVGSTVSIDPISYDYSLQKFKQAKQAAREEWGGSGAIFPG